MTGTERAAEAAEAARAAGLRYTGRQKPGIRREPAGDGFRYLAPDGSEVADERTLARIRSLAIPPAYTEVWINTDPRGHLQATGRDARGRKQYRYHPRWREARDETKYHRTIAFGRALPAIRARVEADLRRPGLPREKVLAAVVRLLETTLIRVGNDEYARSNKSYGLTTLRNRHARVEGADIKFHFRGKSGVTHTITLHDRRLANIVRRSQDLPGQELFGYLDEQGNAVDVTSDDVNDYLREIAGDEFTAKDFRTWAGTVLAAQTLKAIGLAETKTESRRRLKQAIEEVAAKLGNTPTVCRKCYVHPVVVNAYMEGTLVDTLSQMAEEIFLEDGKLSEGEAAVLSFLEQKSREP